MQVKLRCVRAKAVREVCQAPQPRVRALWFIPLQLRCVRCAGKLVESERLSIKRHGQC